MDYVPLWEPQLLSRPLLRCTLLHFAQSLLESDRAHSAQPSRPPPHCIYSIIMTAYRWPSNVAVSVTTYHKREAGKSCVCMNNIRIETTSATQVHVHAAPAIQCATNAHKYTTSCLCVIRTHAKRVRKHQSYAVVDAGAGGKRTLITHPAHSTG